VAKTACVIGQAQRDTGSPRKRAIMFGVPPSGGQTRLHIQTHLKAGLRTVAAPKCASSWRPRKNFQLCRAPDWGEYDVGPA